MKQRKYETRFDIEKDDATITIGGSEYQCSVKCSGVAEYDSGCRGTWDDPPEDDEVDVVSVELEITLCDYDGKDVGTLKIDTLQAFNLFFDDCDEEILESCRKGGGE